MRYLLLALAGVWLLTLCLSNYLYDMGTFYLRLYGLEAWAAMRERAKHVILPRARLLLAVLAAACLLGALWN